MKTQFLVTFEFRYSDAPKHDGESEQYCNKKVTIGVFDTRDEANEAGNKELEKFEARFKLNPNYNKKERFSNNGGCFGSANTLISNLGYIQTPFTFYAKITELKYNDIDTVIDGVIDAAKRYRKYKKNLND